ncbi:hypothetical protein SEA_CRICKO_78 [Streptomyces phage CricKo]|nr:hypothetical protein SEA_RAINYDAI_75 [Streptomyces phage Rainydai]QJD49961.1 hypothetical protein SEA_CRICKO_78 [Streptomyces phage CricKo]QNL30693.1 hypothetical protein SEA_THIQQUMS_78 [Streptomyces phage Thiqqums]
MSEKNPRTTRVGQWEVETTDPHVSFGELLDSVDDALWEDMRNDKSNKLFKLYHFFDSKKKPLDLTEFYDFLGSLTIEDELYYFQAIEVLNG